MQIALQASPGGRRERSAWRHPDLRELVAGDPGSAASSTASGPRFCGTKEMGLPVHVGPPPGSTRRVRRVRREGSRSATPRSTKRCTVLGSQPTSWAAAEPQRVRSYEGDSMRKNTQLSTTEAIIGRCWHNHPWTPRTQRGCRRRVRRKGPPTATSRTVFETAHVGDIDGVIGMIGQCAEVAPVGRGLQRDKSRAAAPARCGRA